VIATRDLRSERSRDAAPSHVSVDLHAETERDRELLRRLLELEDLAPLLVRALELLPLLSR
jgi:hypothetical protein